MENNESYYQTIKTSLKSVVRSNDVIIKLNNTALMINRIMTHSLLFLKLYLIHCYDNNVQLPKLDKQFITSVMKVLCITPKPRGNINNSTIEIKDTLTLFYKEHYEKFQLGEKLNYINMTTILNSYMNTEIITMYETNIKQNFVEYVERFVNVVWDKKGRIESIKQSKSKTETSDISKLCSDLRKIKNDLLNVGKDKTSDSCYHEWINQEILKMMPTRKLEENSVYYDIKCKPQDYLLFMFYMMKYIEALDEKISNVCPLRSEIIPKHFTLDTDTLIRLCFTKKQGTKTFYRSNGNIVKHQDRIWNFFFKTDMKCFHRCNDNHKYTFDHMIYTDGVSCSILLKRKGYIGRDVRLPEIIKRDEQYIDELDPKKLESLKDKKIVAIDPNLSDLLYCVDSNEKDQVKYRYTQDTRRKETKQKKYRDILQEHKKTYIEDKTVQEWENILSNFNKKTLDFVKFKDYIKQKNEINLKLSEFYNKYLFRKLKLSSYIRRQITEDRLLKRFKNMFGDKNGTIVCIGDFEQKHHMKFKEPVKGKGFRSLFRKAGYSVFLVDEHRTSCRCSFCGGECEKFRKCKNPRPWREIFGLILRHGLVRCKTCSRLWNRDTNAASNIYKISKNAVDGLKRPDYLNRKSKT